MYAAAKSLQSCPTLCDPIGGSPAGSLVPGILQARTLEWVAISFSNAWKWKVNVKSLSRVRLLATLWTAAHQAPLSMGFSRQEYWSGASSPSPKNTGVCIYSLLCQLLRRVQLFMTPMACPWNSPGKNTGVVCHSLLQGIFLTQGSNLGLLHSRQILYHLSYQGSPIYSLVILFNMNIHMLCWRNIKVSDYAVLSQTLLRLLI